MKKLIVIFAVMLLAGGAVGQNWYNTQNDIRAVRSHSQDDVAICFENAVVYQYTAASTATPTASYLKPYNVALSSPGRWEAKLTLGVMAGTSSTTITSTVDTMGVRVTASNASVWRMLITPSGTVTTTIITSAP